MAANASKAWIVLLAVSHALVVGLVAANADQRASSSETRRWAYSPLIRPEKPDVGEGQRVRSPIDAFIIARHQEHGLVMSPPAERRALIRRATFDLTGLLPAPEEVIAFLDDSRPHASAALIDRLLASPRYGERWARHWMDVIHFAETQGHDEDAIREHAWPYRDYLIQSFNQDKPYARFIQEQVAGDVLFPDDPQAVVATGFLAAGPWDASSQMGIQDGTIDKKIAQYLDRDDMLTTTMGTFVSLTVHCARCHDHKFDPIPQEDYYALQAVFAGVDRTDRSYDVDAVLHRQRRALRDEKARIEQNQISADLEDPRFNRELTERERARQQPDLWSILHPESVVTESEPRQTVTYPGDGSILLGGPRPDKDTLIVRGRTSLSRITAIQLEVLTDTTLPHLGPGRQDNGNLHLSEFSLKVEPRSATADASNVGMPTSRAIPLKNPVADFNQKDWTIDKALDAEVTTAWGIYPRVGQSHRAIFHLQTPLICEDDTVLVFRLEQAHGGGHLIGRPRLSLTDAEGPIRIDSLPMDIRKIIATDPAERSPQQQLDLARHYLKHRNETMIESLPPPRKVFAVSSDFPGQGNFKPALMPRPVHVLQKGNVRNPGPLAQPGALSCIAGFSASWAEDLEAWS